MAGEVIAALALAVLGQAPVAARVDTGVAGAVDAGVHASVDAGVPASVVIPVADASTAGLGAVPADELLRRERQALKGLGTHRLRIEKAERFDGVLSPVQVMEVVVRQRPFAFVADVVDGPSTGRRFLYNVSLRPREICARESGVLGLAGGVWINVDNPLTRRDSHHPATMLGLGSVLDNIAADNKKAAAAGGHTRVDEGFDKDGDWCMRFTAPRGVTGLYTQDSRLCVDPRTFLLTRLEARDEKGVIERFRFTVLASGLHVDDSAFTPEGAGL